MKGRRIKKQRGELVADLAEQVELLVHSCNSFDQGFESIGKHIALSLRLLLHHKGASRALLEQLGLRSKRFLDTAGDLDPRNLLTDCSLCAMQVGQIGRWVPLCAADGGAFLPRWMPFDRWWNNNVIKDNKRRYFNRRELVLSVAETDGGAHVDPSLDEAYLDLSRRNSLGWTLTVGDVQQPLPAPTMASLRQIAHEVLETLKVKAKNEVDVAYAV